MSSFDVSSIGKPPLIGPRAKRRHVRSLTGSHYLYIPYFEPTRGTTPALSHGDFPEVDEKGQEKWPRGDEQSWKAALRDIHAEVPEITKSVVTHVQTSLGRAPYNIDDFGAYQAAALSVRDNLIVNWNATQVEYTRKSPKRAYYLSLEFLMGRTLSNALLNLGLLDNYSSSLSSLGFGLEDVLVQERRRRTRQWRPRSPRCMLSGLVCHSGVARVGSLRATTARNSRPDPWLDHQNPWELPRLDVTYEVRFYGHAQRWGGEYWSCDVERWTGVLAVAYDVMIPGYGTKSTNNLRLWESKPKRGFDLQSFNAGNYERAVEHLTQQPQSHPCSIRMTITSFGKELRLKQQYFWTAASLADMMRRFKNLEKPISEFAEYDEELSWDNAWSIVTNTFFFTNHTVLPLTVVQEALEKWTYSNNSKEHQAPAQRLFLQSVEKKFPGDRERLSRVSLIEERASPSMVRMANLAVVGSKKVNGVAELHSDLVKKNLFPDFVEFYGKSKFGNVTNGNYAPEVARPGTLPAHTPCNPARSALITDTLKLDRVVWLKDLTKLEGLLAHADDAKFQDRWAAVKHQNKERLALFVERQLGVKVDANAMFDVQIKRLHEYKRPNTQYPRCYSQVPVDQEHDPRGAREGRKKGGFFAGKAAPAYYIAKLTIRLIVNVARVINSDLDTNKYLHFLPAGLFRSLAEILIPASDISQHISTAVLRHPIAEEVGEDTSSSLGISRPMWRICGISTHYHPIPVEQKCPALAHVLDTVSSGIFGGDGVYEPLLNTVRQGDFYILTDDFDAYIRSLEMVDEAYADRAEWIKKSIRTTAKMGKFSSDRAIQDYAHGILEHREYNIKL
ncbi:glycosyltransferase family 35 protein [Lactarius pseudohatsudake]|nr:glycosyltransferase family 35 protein [Lactarius pseudohatsudake]